MTKLYIATLFLIMIAIEPLQGHTFKLITVQKNFAPSSSSKEFLEGVNDVILTKITVINSLVGALVQVKQNVKLNFVTALKNQILSATSFIGPANVAPIGAPYLITVRKVKPVLLDKTISVAVPEASTLTAVARSIARAKF